MVGLASARRSAAETAAWMRPCESCILLVRWASPMRVRIRFGAARVVDAAALPYRSGSVGGLGFRLVLAIVRLRSLVLAIVRLRLKGASCVRRRGGGVFLRLAEKGC
jgi:hypothetical protein